jgi:carbon-monoxide dehydrogenase large subunit
VTPLGDPLQRVEDDRLLRGRARYLADLTLPRMLEAVFVRSPHPAADVMAIDIDRARAAPGVVAVLTAADIPHEPLVDSVRVDGLRKTPQPALATGRVRFVGEAVAIVLAERRALAEDAAELVAVQWRPHRAVVDVDGARSRGAPLVDPSVPGNLLFAQHKRYGDPASAFAAADLIVELELHGNRYGGSPIETRGCLAEFAGDRLNVWCSTQGPHLLRRRIALCTGIPEHHIRVIVPDVGGGFGVKIPAAPEEIAVALAARAVGRPVRWVEDRSEHVIAAPQAKEQHIAVALALAADGAFRGLRASIVGDAGGYSFNSASALIEPYLSAGLMPGPYRIDHVEVEIAAVLTNKPPICPYRGVGWTQGHTARELAIERAARRLGRDPASLRRQNLVRKFPHRSCTGMVYDSGSFVSSLDSVLELAGYEDARREQAVRREGERRVGVGVTAYVEPTAWGSEGALQSEWSFASHDSVRLQMEPTGKVIAAVGTPTQGQGHATTLGQIVANELSVALADVTILSADTDATPLSSAGTRASRIATVIGGALALGCAALRERLLAVAAAKLDLPRSDLRLADGQVVGGVRPLSVREVAEAAYFDVSIRECVPDPELVVTQFYDPPATYSNGAIAAVVEVDTGTGAVTVLHLAAVEDCGTMLNPTIVDSQLAGALVQGLGGALLEETAYGPDGQPLSTSLDSYLLPRITDVPEIAIAHECSPSPVTVLGIKGMGESGAIAAPAAIAAAVEDALARDGFLVSRLPLSAERVLAGLGVLA